MVYECIVLLILSESNSKRFKKNCFLFPELSLFLPGHFPTLFDYVGLLQFARFFPPHISVGP